MRGQTRPGSGPVERPKGYGDPYQRAVGALAPEPPPGSTVQQRSGVGGVVAAHPAGDPVERHPDDSRPARAAAQAADLR